MVKIFKVIMSFVEKNRIGVKIMNDKKLEWPKYQNLKLISV